MASALIKHMKDKGVKTLGFIGYADGYGELWLKVLDKALKDAGITMAPVERFARNDTSVTGQVLKIVAANPDAVLVAASGTPAALPNLAFADRGYKGQIYHTHGSASLDFIRVAGKTAEGTILPVGPVVVAEQLPDSHPSKKIGMEYTKLYEEKYGKGSVSSFGGHMYDAAQLLTATIPVALKAAKPGTPEFRTALRDALEGMKEVVGVHGVFNTSATDHYGHDERSRVLMTVEGGAWKYMP
jgi:branched-chain amino acid transport system substrate-binding protein